jgi:hypothetical protein
MSAALRWKRPTSRGPATDREARRYVPYAPTPRVARPTCPACGTPMLDIGRGEFHCRIDLTIYRREDDLTWRLIRR